MCPACAFSARLPQRQSDCQASMRACVLSFLQGTKACLGWDRVAAALTTGTTAVTDLWLQLLLRTIQVARERA